MKHSTIILLILFLVVISCKEKEQATAKIKLTTANIKLTTANIK